MKFALKMEKKAYDIAKQFEKEIHGVKCWYSVARLFSQRAERVFVGINPGGGEESDSKLKKSKIRQQPSYKNPRFNAWLDESWGKPPGKAMLQRKVRCVFETLYEDNWENVFRNTPCFNASPFRSQDINKLPEDAWRASKSWFQEIMEHLKPRVIICMGNGERSPWNILCDVYSVDKKPQDLIQRRTYYLKQGAISTSPLIDTRIIALPHLKRIGKDNLIRRLRSLSQAQCLP